MELTITNNNAKLFNYTFLHLHMDKSNKLFQEGGKYKCVSDQYGHVGEVECIKQTTTMLNSLSAMTMMLAEGNTYYIDQMQQKGFMKVEAVQVCVFHFIRRSDDRFKTLIEGEAQKMHLNLIKQSNLFQTA